MNRTIGVAVVGTGFGAAVVAPTFAAVDGAEVRAIGSADPERAAAAAARLDVPFATDDTAALFARPEIDLVCVVTPPHRHCELVVAALEAGKHVFCEKPFGLNLQEAGLMLDTAKRVDQLHFLDFEFRTVPARRALAELIDSGGLGEIRHVVITAMVAGERFPVMNRYGWWQESERGGGWLGAMGSHYIDALRCWFGEIREVSASLETRRRALADAASDDTPLITADDGFVAQLRTESDISCTLVTASSVYAELGPRVEVYGSRGTALLEGDTHLSIARDDEPLAPFAIHAARDDHATAHPSRGPLGTWAAVVIDAVRDGRQIAPNFDDGVRCQEVMAAMRASSAAGGSWTRVDREG